MLVGLIVVGILVLAWPLAVGVSRPANGLTRGRDAERRSRYVARNPHEVNAGDIRTMLGAGGLDAEQVQFVSSRAAELGIKPFTMLVWLKRFDAQALATVIAADLSQHELIAHISNGTVPDLAELAVFAELNGFATVTTAQPKPVRRERVVAAHVATTAAQLPTITSPENWAMDDGAPVTLESLGLYDLPPHHEDGDEQDRHAA